MLKFLDKTGLDTLWAKIKSTFQTLGNLVTAWGSTPSDTKYPSEKLVKTALDAKVPGKALSVSVPASSTRYVKMVVPSGYHHYLVFFNASLGNLHAEWLFRSYGAGGTTRTVVNYIGALVAARKWYVAGASGNTFYIEFVNNTTGSKTVNFKVCALDISALPTLTVESEVPSGYVEQPVVGTVASQLLTARELAVSLSNTSTDTTFNGSANVTNIKVGGTLGVANGGTGKSSVTNNNFLVGNGTGALVEKTPSEVRTLIGAGTSSLTIGTSSTQAAAGDHKHGTMHSSFTRTVPDQSSDTTWATNLGLENNGFWLKSLRMQNNAPNWLVNNFGAGIAFGGADTKGVISLAYDNSAQVRFAGGNGQSPNWYWTLKGSSGKTYTLPSDTCSLQAALPTTGTASTTYAINVSGNAATATSATTATNFDTSGGTIKSSLNAKVNIASDGVVATSNSHWDIIMQVATIASSGVHYKRWLCNSDGTSAFVDHRPNSDNSSFMLEAYAVKWNSYEDCKYKLLYWRAGKQTPYVAELIFYQAQGLFPQTIAWYDTGVADTKVKATAKTNDTANYKILATASASPTSGSATEAVYSPNITLNPSTNTISANITGDAQSVRGLYITKTIVNDPNAIIFF